MYYYSMAKEVVDDSVSGTDNLLNNVKISKLHILQLVNEIAYMLYTNITDMRNDYQIIR